MYTIWPQINSSKPDLYIFTLVVGGVLSLMINQRVFHCERTPFSLHMAAILPLYCRANHHVFACRSQHIVTITHMPISPPRAPRRPSEYNSPRICNTAYNATWFNGRNKIPQAPQKMACRNNGVFPRLEGQLRRSYCICTSGVTLSVCL